MSALEGKCPGCGRWVLLGRGAKMMAHDPNGGTCSHALAVASHLQCPWGGRVPPETRPRQLEMRGAS